MMITTMFYSLAILLNAAIAVYDFSFYRIPNMLVLGLLVLYVISSPFILSWDDIIPAVSLFAGMLVLGFVFFYMGLFGGGDAKYLAVAALWAGLDDLVLFVLVVTLSGGVLALSYLFAQPYISQYATRLWTVITGLEKQYTQLQYVWSFSGDGHETGKKKPALDKNKLPYGVAISVGMIAVFCWKVAA